jgi:hypothetical protein
MIYIQCVSYREGCVCCVMMDILTHREQMVDRFSQGRGVQAGRPYIRLWRHMYVRTPPVRHIAITGRGVYINIYTHHPCVRHARNILFINQQMNKCSESLLSYCIQCVSYREGCLHLEGCCASPIGVKRSDHVR